MAEQFYRSSPKTFDLIGRSTNHGENLETNLHLIIMQPNQTRNLHLQRRKASATKSLVLKCNKRKQRHENDLMSAHHCVLFATMFHASLN